MLLDDSSAQSFAWLRPGELKDMLQEVGWRDEGEVKEDDLSIAYGAFAYTTATHSAQHGRTAVFMRLCPRRRMRQLFSSKPSQLPPERPLERMSEEKAN